MTSDEKTETDEEDGFDDELSLARLSEAYAEVIRQQANPESNDGEQSRGELVADKVARNEVVDNIQDDGEEDEVENDTGVDDNSACPITPESIVESILFVGVPRGEKLTSKKIASVMRDVSPKEVLAVAKNLNERYERENAAYRIKVDTDSIRMVIADDLAEFQNEYFGRNREISLSQSAIDILAVVAYRQPISRDEIEKTRNKPVGSVLNQLVRRDLLATTPDEKRPRKKLFHTTERFLDLFHLSDLNDLPQTHEVSDLDDFE
jgi:segregation and condensation protein B